ncbi:exported protein of unknown function [Lactobacillus delbrueckii subsp. delbrueckii]|uniref:Uncharacterized protein n=1 Tax=Lactobacillus delbrueckii subsp. delbrueckii TaxID=83684 RepID=A0AAU9R2V9_9LACO|nr:exported protein of unknown function [Lactobacillus delbrueckii subsp. delbrueckii]
MHKKKIASITILATAALLTACGQNKGASSSKQVMKTAVTGEISTLDSSKYGDTPSALKPCRTPWKGSTALTKRGRPGWPGRSR